MLFDWYWNRIWPMLQTENEYNIDNGGCRIQGCIFTISSWKAPLQSKIYTPGGKTVLTVSILGVSRFHLKRVMHLEHGQMSQRGQSRTRQHSLADKIRTGNKTLYIQHRYERDFFFLKISIWNFVVSKWHACWIVFLLFLRLTQEFEYFAIHWGEWKYFGTVRLLGESSEC